VQRYKTAAVSKIGVWSPPPPDLFSRVDTDEKNKFKLLWILADAGQDFRDAVFKWMCPDVFLFLS